MGRLVYIDKTDTYYIRVTEFDQYSLSFIPFVERNNPLFDMKQFQKIFMVPKNTIFFINRVVLKTSSLQAKQSCQEILN